MSTLATVVKTLLIVLAFCLAWAAPADAQSQPENVKCFRNLIKVEGPVFSSTLENYLDGPGGVWDNLKFRTNYTDASGNSDFVVSKTGYENPNNPYNWIGEKWSIGFLRYTFGGVFIGAYATNENFYSNRWPNILGGWFKGDMYSYFFPNGTKPDDIIIVHDVDGDGIGNLSSNGALTFPGDDGNAYYYKDLIIKGKRGDTSELPVNAGPSPIIIPSIVISPYSEIPVEDRGARATFFNGTREGFSGPLDFLELSRSWLTTGSGPHNYWGGGADWNTDGVVDIKDLLILAERWDPANYLNK